MNERTKQFRVGVVAIATVVITAILITWHSDFSSLPFSDTYTVRIIVDRAPGVAPNTPVRRRGILIGRVTAVEATDEGALITAAIQAGQEIKTNETPRIQSSLIGDAVIEFVPNPPAADAGARRALDGARLHEVSFMRAQDIAPEVRAVTPDDPPIVGIYNPTPIDLLAEIQGDLKQTVISLGDAGRQVAELAARFNNVLGAQDVDRINRLVANADIAMAGMAQTSQALNDLLGDEEFRQNIKDGMAQLPTTVSDARAVFDALERMLESAEANLANLTGLTGPLGERGENIVAALESAIRNLEVLFNEVALLTANINKSEGSLGLLMRDRVLYDRLLDVVVQANDTIGEVRLLTGNPEVRARIKQIIDNINTITQKIKMDPARVIRGAVNRETPLPEHTRPY